MKWNEVTFTVLLLHGVDGLCAVHEVRLPCPGSRGRTRCVMGIEQRAADRRWACWVTTSDAVEVLAQRGVHRVRRLGIDQVCGVRDDDEPRPRDAVGDLP